MGNRENCNRIPHNGKNVLDVLNVLSGVLLFIVDGVGDDVAYPRIIALIYAANRLPISTTLSPSTS
jgi:hypothetical protein